MNNTPIVGYRAMVNRATGEVMTTPTPVYLEDVVRGEVHPSQPLLRYMDLWKFKDLLETKSLYFSRADKFEDPLEGTLSEKSVYRTSTSDVSQDSVISYSADAYERELEYRDTAKAATFVNCWHINEDESQEMWEAYTSSTSSMLLITTAEKLTASLHEKVIMSPVRYVASDDPRTELFERDLFFYKDEAFRFEQEYRLLIDLGMEAVGRRVSRDGPEDFGRRVIVDIERLVYGIKAHPMATNEDVIELNKLIREHLPHVIECHR
ncbi:hypothetical protein ACFPK9_10710 [Rubritalea spongiae]|uniref:DUF2971 domain-containing protein n=1 Tax=Rubritalea spongiae TaxID=430797 RepID=A0ABW5DZR3_9BACT